jgi:hypothetical protein
MHDPNSSRKRRPSMAAVLMTRDIRFWMSRASQKKNSLEIVVVVNVVLLVARVVFIVA